MSDSRRNFLLKSFSASSAAWLAANWPTEVAAAEKAQAMGAFTYFTREQAGEVDAMAAQIYPSTDTPGAREAQVIYFIDTALVTFAQDKQDIYAKG
ncbi:MAG TPA: gluconate 2-dehydrogenase subunit 3 family protein, partial [Rhizomicrobium sp.]|nr:gluconate 2-dehydrogenase subunit 3 family protein [Rhizomicrobium sp.]